MAKLLATLLELGDRAVIRARRIATLFLGVGEAFGIVHHFQHVFRVVFPVCGQVQYTTHPQFMTDALNKLGLDQPALMVLLLVPRIREEQL